MPDPTTLGLFLATALVLLLTPGPAVLYIMTRSVQQGRLAGIVSAAGICVGSFVHVAAAGLGLSAILVSSAVAFQIVKYAGAAYLVYLGIRKLTERENAQEVLAASPVKLSQAFTQGVIVNILNPKTALFFLAFLPQFVNPARGSVASQCVVLGCMFSFLGALTDSLWAVLGGTLGKWVGGRVNSTRFPRYFAGSVYIGLGIAAAVSGPGKK